MKTKAQTRQYAAGPECTFVVPPRIQSLLTGVRYARIHDNGLVELVYEDNSVERTPTGQPMADIPRDDFFKLVSYVQSFRKPVES